MSKEHANIPDDLQEQVRNHIQHDKLFHWNEALTENEMSYLEQLLLTFCPLFPKGSIGYEKWVRYIQSNTTPSTTVEQAAGDCTELDIRVLQALIYYSQIHTVRNVIDAGTMAHEEAWMKAQEWLQNNYKVVDGSYSPSFILAGAALAGDKSCGMGVDMINKERQRQIEVEKWDYSHDEDYANSELIGAAACYAANAINKDKPGFMRVQIHLPTETNIEAGNTGDRGDRQLRKAGWYDAWPWGSEWDKREKHDKMRSLVIAGALIASEIDRLQSKK